MKKCPKCGKENIDEARFCTWCRAELPVILEKKKNDPGRIIAIVILIAAICACLVGVFMLFKDENYGNDQGEEITQKEENGQADKDIPVEKKILGVYLAPFMNDEGKWGYINTDGDVVIECKYDSAFAFDQDGYAVVGMQTDSEASEYYMIYGLINTEGEEIIPLDYSYINSSIGPTCDDYGYRTISRLPYPLYYDEEYSGVMDKNGNIIMSPEYSNISNIGDSGYYVACDAETGLCGIIDEDYEWICEPEYSGIYEVGINENWNVIDSNGEYLFSETHDNHEVNEKYIAGNNEEKKHGILILKSGEVVSTEYQKYMLSYTVPDIVEVYDGANYGMLGENGELIVPCSYDSCEVSEDGVYITANRQRDEDGYYTECTLFDTNGNEIRTFDTGIYNVGAFQKVSDVA